MLKRLDLLLHEFADLQYILKASSHTQTIHYQYDLLTMPECFARIKMFIPVLRTYWIMLDLNDSKIDTRI